LDDPTYKKWKKSDGLWAIYEEGEESEFYFVKALDD